MAQRNNYVGGNISATKTNAAMGPPKTAEDQYADQVYKRIIEFSGGQHQLVDNP